MPFSFHPFIMAPNRRRVLQGLGIGVAVGLLGRPTAASGTERVFVHPRTGLVADVLDAVDAVGGTTLLEYENFDFTVAAIPSDRRQDLRVDPRVAFIETDDGVGIPGDWTPSVPDILDPGGEVDCSDHPDQRQSWGRERIEADAVDPDGSGVDVGILDTGIQTDHCSLSVAGGRNFTADGSANDYDDNHGHGTHVAGITGALNNDIGVVGVAPAANLYAVKVLDDSGSGRYSTLVAGIDWCISNDVELISMSLGGESNSSSVDQAIEQAHAAGHLLLAAAGNNGNESDGKCGEETMTYPGTHDDVVAVTAMDEDDTLASYSSVGATADLLAPGTDIESTHVDNEYASASGTSAACPFVTGVATLIWQGHSTPGPGPNDTVRDTLTGSAETVLGTCEEGAGLVNARAAVDDHRESPPEGSDEPADDEDQVTDDEPAPGADHDEGHVEDGHDGTGTPSLFQRLRTLLGAILDWFRRLFWF